MNRVKLVNPFLVKCRPNVSNKLFILHILTPMHFKHIMHATGWVKMCNMNKLLATFSLHLMGTFLDCMEHIHQLNSRIYHLLLLCVLDSSSVQQLLVGQTTPKPSSSTLFAMCYMVMTKLRQWLFCSSHTRSWNCPFKISQFLSVWYATLNLKIHSSRIILYLNKLIILARNCCNRSSMGICI